MGYYNAVIVGAIYEFPTATQFHPPTLFFHPLKRCVEDYPFLGVTVGDPKTEKPFYKSVPKINLEDHISIDTSYTSNHDEWTAIERILPPILDAEFPSGVPPWKIVVLPLTSTRCFVVFAYSHTIGDGPSGVAFHHTFLKALEEKSTVSPSELQIITVPSNQLPVPVDTPERLPISWSFLLMPILNHLLPQFIRNLLGLRPAGSSVDEKTWTGSLVPEDAKGSHSKLKLLEIKAPLLARALAASRENNTRLTGVFHEVIARALSRSVTDPQFTNFVAQTPINLRKCLGIPEKEFGNLVSGCYTVKPRVRESAPLSDIWEGSRECSKQLAECASTSQDQLIGLFRYVSNIRQWTMAKLGQQRDCSFEVSNLGVFNNERGSSVDAVESRVNIVEVVFAQPGHVLSTPVAFNLASVKGGSLVVTATWQVGALGIKVGEEDEFVDGLFASIKADLEAL